jgi:hypothetical protein
MLQKFVEIAGRTALQVSLVDTTEQVVLVPYASRKLVLAGQELSCSVLACCTDRVGTERGGVELSWGDEFQ